MSSPAAPQGKKVSGKKCLRGFCKCKAPIRDGLFAPRLSANMPKREEQLRFILGPRHLWPQELLLPAGTGEGHLGDVRIAAHHYPDAQLKKTTRGGKGARQPSTARLHHAHSSQY